MSELPRRYRYKNRETVAEKEKWENVAEKRLPPNYQKFIEEQAGGLAKTKVEEFADRHKRLPDRKEIEEIAESIFNQLSQKKQERPKSKKKQRTILEERKSRREKLKMENKKHEGRQKHFEMKTKKGTLGKKMEQKQEPKTEGKKNETSIEGLFDDEKDADIGLKEFPEDDEISDIEAGDDLVGLEEEPGENACPNCKSATQDTVFCPKCGTGFCRKCAKKVEKTTEGFSVTCPKCGSVFSTRIIH